MADITQVEKIARALCKADGIDPDADWFDGIEDQTTAWKGYERRAQAIAEAALESFSALKTLYHATRHGFGTNAALREAEDAIAKAEGQPEPVFEGGPK